MCCCPLSLSSFGGALALLGRAAFPLGRAVSFRFIPLLWVVLFHSFVWVLLSNSPLLGAFCIITKKYMFFTDYRMAGCTEGPSSSPLCLSFPGKTRYPLLPRRGSRPN